MSEGLPGVDFQLPPAGLRDAAAVILVRPGTIATQELFWVRRGEQLRFSGGFHAFPGGKVDAADAATPIGRCPAGEESLRVCAIRETFEETGVLLAQGAERLSPARLLALREELLAGGSFAALLSREGLLPDAALLAPAGRWVTPPISPIRFDCRFFLARLPAGQEASIIPGELSGGGFIRPADALAAWERGEVLLHPPNHHAVAILAGHGLESALPRLRAPPFVGADHVVTRIEFQRGVQLVALRTPTLPPAFHTNCWIVGTGELVLIDPGSPFPEEQELLASRVAELVAEGRRARAVLLTHHHGDHIGGALDIARRLEVPVWASAETAARVPGAVGCLEDGKLLSLDGPLPVRLGCLLTEGHAPGHLCFEDERSRALFAGDMVAAGSTIVIDPPEGDMGVYLASLHRLLDRFPGTLYPAHGYPIPDGAAKLREYVTHREARLTQLEEALADGLRDLPALVERVYADTPPFLHPIAERSALASLLELARRGKAREVAGRWEPQR